MNKKLGIKEKVETRPKFFDFRPLKDAMRRFLCNTAEERTKIRTLFLERQQQVRNVFKDVNGEVSFKKVMDVHEFARALVENGISLEKDL